LCYREQQKIEGEGAAMRHMRMALLGLLASLVALLIVSPAPLAADHGALSLTPAPDQPLATISLRHSRSRVTPARESGGNYLLHHLRVIKTLI